MATGYLDLLDSAIDYVRSLKQRGVKHVAVDRERLDALGSLPPKRQATRSAKAQPNPSGPQASEEPSPVEAAPSSQAGSAAAPAATTTEPRKKGPELFGENVADSDHAPSTAPSPEPLSVTRAETKEDREKAMEELRQKASVCQRCPNLAAARRNVVFGVGDMHSPLMFVGEAPGMDEDRQGEPFVGKAGQLLTKIIETMGYSRDTVYIANVLKCRPDTPGKTSGNRKPEAKEMSTCLPYLLRQIDLIQPRVIVALGATALQGLTGHAQSITKVRGRFQTFRGIPLMPTFHPSYLLRYQTLTEKRKVWEDMLQVMETLELEISERQRNYFLKKGA